MALPSFLQPCLASYNLSKMDKNRDKITIITEVLNKGDGEALNWLCKTYTQKQIRAVIKNPTRGMWLSEILTYWLKIFEIKLPENVFKAAIIDLNP